MNKSKTTLFKENDLTNIYEDRLGLVYARVSSEKQKNEGSGLESQEVRCIKDLQSINIPYVKTFPDSFTGKGDFMKRPAMRDLLEYVDSHPHQKFVVVFDDLKRFARDTEFHFKLKTALRFRDVIPKCLNYNFDDSPEGIFTETIFAAQGQLEREQNRRQVIQKQKARLELGYWSFGSKKGYTMTRNSEHGTISIPNKEGLEMLKPALEGFAKGMFLHKVDVCKFLVEQGFWKKQLPEKYIDKLTQIFRDPFYAGYIQYSNWEVARRTGRHQAIISLETFEAIQKRLDKLDSGKRIRKDTSDDFPLRGLLVCADCQSHLTAAWCKGRNMRHPYYYCQKRGCISRNKMTRKDVIESRFDKILKENTLKKDISKILQAVFDKVWKEEIVNIRKSLINSKFERDNLERQVDEFMSRIISAKTETMKEAYEDKIEKLRKEIEQVNSNMPIENVDLNVPYQTALEKAICLLKSPYDIWITLDTKEKQRLFYFIFEEKLPYSKKTGYQTNKIPSVVRLFEDFSTSNTRHVEMRGIEPRCRRFLQGSLHA